MFRATMCSSSGETLMELSTREFHLQSTATGKPYQQTKLPSLKLNTCQSLASYRFVLVVSHTSQNKWISNQNSPRTKFACTYTHIFVFAKHKQSLNQGFVTM